jgi:hypothetical protein
MVHLARQGRLVLGAKDSGYRARPTLGEHHSLLTQITTERHDGLGRLFSRTGRWASPLGLVLDRSILFRMRYGSSVPTCIKDDIVMGATDLVHHFRETMSEKDEHAVRVGVRALHTAAQELASVPLPPVGRKEKIVRERVRLTVQFNKKADDELRRLADASWRGPGPAPRSSDTATEAQSGKEDTSGRDRESPGGSSGATIQRDDDK